MIETVQQSSKQTFYEMLGGEQVVYELVEHFYDLVETDLIGEPVHVLHQQGMGINHLRQAQFEYLSGFLGGPQLYIERYGHSINRKIHEHLEIGTPEIEAWLKCMAKAIDKTGVSAGAQQQLMTVFKHAAKKLNTAKD